MPWMDKCKHCGYVEVSETRREASRAMFLHCLRSHPSKRYWAEVQITWGQLQEYETFKSESLYWFVVRNYRRIIAAAE